MKKNVLTIILIFAILILFSSTIVATGESFITGTEPIAPSGNAQITSVVPKIWLSVKLVLQVLALSAFLVTGIKYMMASADQKADIKKSLIMTIIGVALVFGTTIVIDFVTGVAKQVMGV